MKENRGRPKEIQTEQFDKWTRKFNEVPSKPELGWQMTWYYDINKT
jgi:hypothetical protein